MRTGVYLCQAGTADGAAVNAQSVEHYAANLPQVELVRDLGTLPPLDLPALAAEIHSNRLERLVIAGDSPGFFKPAFATAMAMAGGDPEEVRLASFREHGAASGIANVRAKSVLACAVLRSAVRAGRGAQYHRRAPRHADRGRRRGRHPGRPRDRRRRQAGLPGRAHRHHRRPHGDVRQDLPHPRLRGVHPHAQDGRRRASTRSST